VWRPDRHDLVSFLEELAGQDAFVTARAHGAICAACLGRASVILEIEPKLRAVHDMLPRATRLAAVDSDAATLGALIDEVLDIPVPMIAQDVTANREASRRALDEVSARCGA
jgi:polysaccharide pyruvyl transferase WcaK-like protein